MERCKFLTSSDSFSKEVALSPPWRQKTTHNVRYFASLFGDSELQKSQGQVFDSPQGRGKALAHF